MQPMEGEDDDFSSLHEDSMDVGLQATNRLDLNVEQDSRSPKVVYVNGTQSNPPSIGADSKDSVLEVGTEFESDEHAYKSYNKYARLVGFNVRKDWVNKSKVHGQVVSRKFTCSKEGYRRKDKRDVNVKKHRKETRTGCLAHMIITRQPDGKYRVTQFEEQHNHGNVNSSIAQALPEQHNHDNVNLSIAQALPLQRECTVPEAADADSVKELGSLSKSALDSMNRGYRVRESVDSSHLVESLFHDLRNYLYSDVDVLDFVKYFEKVVDEQRYKEIEANDEMNRCMPRLMGNVILLKHASDVYTPRAFEVFQRGYEKCLNIVVNQCSENGPLFEYKTNIFGKQNDVPSIRDNPKLVVASRYKNMCGRIIMLSAKASESEEAFQFAVGQLDEVMEGVEKILTLKPQDAQAFTSSSTANASDSERAVIFPDGNAIEDQDDNVVKGAKEKETAVFDKGQLTNVNGEFSSTKRIQNVDTSLQNTDSCISSPSLYVSPEGTTANPIMQGLYNFEANQVVQCMYQQDNLVMEEQANPNMYQPLNFFSNQHDSPGHSQLLQEPLINGTYQEPVSSTPELRQAMDLDVQHAHSSSFLLLDRG
ncbi:hypothetical protein GBA52_006152 [Prunus armeniaca]|nr:hypothetical protein GBA52_006152 [Prunus armeniaca]